MLNDDVFILLAHSITGSIRTKEPLRRLKDSDSRAHAIVSDDKEQQRDLAFLTLTYFIILNYSQRYNGQ
jgi:hypothetical protein